MSEEKIKSLIDENPVMLFMKGEPEKPLCGFSARVVQILDFLKVKYESFDILSDETLRQDLKSFSSWPTFPQLYIKKEFVGGCDIVQEQFQSGDLEKSLKDFIQA